MPLAAGQSLSFYEILGPLGAGGMGEVYRARDTRLDRHVAIKVLPDEFTSDENRLRRFEREAKVLATLNHPNVTVIHGIEQEGDICFLVLELVDGEDLAKRLERGRLSVTESLEVANQIALGLEEAHEHGVVHRDLKPGNVVLTKSGKAKVVDFGLARREELAPETRAELESLSAGLTSPGLVLGTPAYMSPEQSRGVEVDGRCDIWAFGCILYECLTGERAFTGASLPEVFVAIHERSPDLTRLPSSTPPRVVEMLESCLEKKREDRLRNVGDAGLVLRRELSGSGSRASSPTAPTRAATRSVWKLLVLAGLVALVAGFVGRAFAPEFAPSHATHLSVGFDQGQRILMNGRHYFAVSPDAEFMVYVSQAPAGASTNTLLRLRRFDDFRARVLVGTEEAHSPFFSPDGKWIGYFALGGIFKVAVSGGTPVKICDSDSGIGASWSGDHIVFAAGWEVPLSIVAAAGGVPAPLTVLDRERGELSHRLPHAFQDGRFVLYTVKTEDLQTFDLAEIYLFDRESGASRLVLRGGSDARYLGSGHLVYGSSNRLFATTFDPETAIAGPPVEVANRVITLPEGGLCLYDVSRDGTLVFSTGPASRPITRLLAYDRASEKMEELTPPEEWRPYQEIQLSRDGGRFLVRVMSANDDLWTWDLQNQLATRQTFGGGNTTYGVWSHDDTEFFYSGGTGNIWRAAVDSTGSHVDLGFAGTPCDVSPDGEWLLFERNEDLWIYALDGSADPWPWLATASVYEGSGKFSPDGDCVVFESGSLNEPDLYTARFQPARDGDAKILERGRTKLVSGFAICPQWTRESGEVIYMTRTGFASIPVSPDGTRRSSAPAVSIYPVADLERIEIFERPFAVSSDGQLLYFLELTIEFNDASVNVHFGWQDELIARVSAEQG